MLPYRSVPWCNDDDFCRCITVSAGIEKIGTARTRTVKHRTIQSSRELKNDGGLGEKDILSFVRLFVHGYRIFILKSNASNSKT